MRQGDGPRLRRRSFGGRFCCRCCARGRSERLLMEEMDYNLLFRWFVGLEMDDEVWDVTVFTKNREHLITGEVARKFFVAVVEQARVSGLLSDEHFTVDGTLIEAWANRRSFVEKSEPPQRARSGQTRDIRNGSSCSSYGCGESYRTWLSTRWSPRLAERVAQRRARWSGICAESEETEACEAGVRVAETYGGTAANQVSRAEAGGMDVPVGGGGAESAPDTALIGTRRLAHGRCGPGRSGSVRAGDLRVAAVETGPKEMAPRKLLIFPQPVKACPDTNRSSANGTSPKPAAGFDAGMLRLFFASFAAVLCDLCGKKKPKRKVR
jgi:transposase-like protein DUF772